MYTCVFPAFYCYRMFMSSPIIIVVSQLLLSENNKEETLS